MVNAAENLADAAQAASAEEDEFEMFVEKLARDEQHLKLLARVLSDAQDSSMRDKREPTAVSWPTQPMRPGPRSTANSLTHMSSPISTLSMSASRAREARMKRARGTSRRMS